jgi:hypothetical protein
MKNIKTSLKVVCIISLLGIFSCKKFLDAKPDNKLAVPSTLSDLQSLLDNYSKLNVKEPVAGEVSSDDFYISTTDWLSLSSEEYRRMYIWEKDRLFANTGNSWSNYSEVVYYSNTVIESLKNIPKSVSNQQEYNSIKGQALFNRAKALLQAAYVWTPAYDGSSSQTDLGLPLRLSTDFNEPSTRASLENTYQQIISDLKQANALLPQQPLHVMRASKPASYALLARTYLSMREYTLAQLYADSCLMLKGDLIDYNSLNPSATYPISRFNSEVIMETMIPSTQIVSTPRAKIVKPLYDLYTTNDLRKNIFFKIVGSDIQFKGSYEGSIALFGGLATDEMYLIMAEGYARSGNVDRAMTNLNRLLLKRWKTGTFVPLTANSPNQAVNMILLERRKELLMRGLRWMDIKRLNKEGAGISLNREINGVSYSLPPNDLRFALPLPEYLIELTGMPQNPR